MHIIEIFKYFEATWCFFILESITHFHFIIVRDLYLAKIKPSSASAGEKGFMGFSPWLFRNGAGSIGRGDGGGKDWEVHKVLCC